ARTVHPLRISTGLPCRSWSDKDPSAAHPLCVRLFPTRVTEAWNGKQGGALRGSGGIRLIRGARVLYMSLWATGLRHDSGSGKTGGRVAGARRLAPDAATAGACRPAG